MAEEAKHEIVIIRRGGHGDHEEHHGGVWKIAFADFMTAMMAFFLVLWLVSANDKTRASVARYFNPVKLVDATTQPRGLHDTKKDESGITASPDTKDTKAGDSKDPNPAGKDVSESKKAEKESKEGRDKRLDSELRENPYAALAEIAATKGPGEAPAQPPARTAAPALGRAGGSAFRDPFAPLPPSHSAKADIDELVADVPPGDPNSVDSANTTQVAKTKTQPRSDQGAVADKQTADLKADLQASLKSISPGKPGPGIDLKRTSEGLLLSLTDTADFSMFTNGSAVPSKKVVLLMEKVAQILKEKSGTIVLRGFTDNKPFKSGRYDNWHLSLDRAQVAHYMLVRGGLDDQRIAHIEGYADRGVKAGVDAANPLNRRIEILLKDMS